MSDAAPAPAAPDKDAIIKSLQLTVTQLQIESAQHELASIQATIMYCNERGPKLQALIAANTAALQQAQQPKE